MKKQGTKDAMPIDSRDAWPAPTDSLEYDLPEPTGDTAEHEGDAGKDNEIQFHPQSGNAGFFTLKSQPEFRFFPLDKISISITLNSCVIGSNDGNHFVTGVGEIIWKNDVVGVLGSTNFVSSQIEVRISPESLIERSYADTSDTRREIRSILGFSSPLEADLYQPGSKASWYAIAYIPDDAIGKLIDAANGQFLNGVTVTLTLTKNICRRQWVNISEGFADSVDRFFKDDRDVLLYLCPSLTSWGYSSSPEEASGPSASLHTVESAVTFTKESDEAKDSDRKPSTELDSLRKRIWRLETTLQWAAIIVVFFVLATMIGNFIHR